MIFYSAGLKSGLTLRWIGEVWENYGGTVGLSLLLALACVVGNLLIGVPCAYAMARSRSRCTGRMPATSSRVASTPSHQAHDERQVL